MKNSIANKGIRFFIYVTTFYGLTPFKWTDEGLERVWYMHIPCCIQLLMAVKYLFDSTVSINWFPSNSDMKLEFIVGILKVAHWLSNAVTHALGIFFRSPRLQNIITDLSILTANSKREIPRCVNLIWFFPSSVIITVLFSLFRNDYHRKSFGKVYFINYYMSFIPQIFVDMLFSIICLRLYVEFDRTNNDVSRLYKYPNNKIMSELLKIKSHHWNLTKVLFGLEKCFSFDLINAVSYILFRSIIFTYIVILDWIHGESESYLVLSQLFLQIILLPARFLYMLYSAHLLTHKSKETLKHLRFLLLINIKNIDYKTLDLVRLFIEQIKIKDTTISPYNIFRLELIMFCNYLGTCLTFILIIVQFME